MDTNISYGLPPAGGRIRSQGNYCLPPAGVLHSQNKVIKFTAYGVAQGRGKGMEEEEEGVEWSKRMYGVRMSPAHPRYVGRGDDTCGGEVVYTIPEIGHFSTPNLKTRRGD